VREGGRGVGGEEKRDVWGGVQGRLGWELHVECIQALLTTRVWEEYTFSRSAKETHLWEDLVLGP
jgi:hypothetical protein